MDHDAVVGAEPEPDSFSLVLPLPYRVSILLVLGMLSVLDSTSRFPSMALVYLYPEAPADSFRCVGLGPDSAISEFFENCTTSPKAYLTDTSNNSSGCPGSDSLSPPSLRESSYSSSLDISSCYPPYGTSCDFAHYFLGSHQGQPSASN